MPAWWGKKSGGSKSSESSAKSSSVKNERKREKEIESRVNSFEEIFQSRNSPRSSREFSAAGREAVGNNSSIEKLSVVDSSGFSGFDSASSLDRAHPLPRPSDPPSDRAQGAGNGSGSGSVSSVSSSGSCDDHAHGAADQSAFRFV